MAASIVMSFTSDGPEVNVARSWSVAPATGWDTSDASGGDFRLSLLYTRGPSSDVAVAATVPPSKTAPMGADQFSMVVTSAGIIAASNATCRYERRSTPEDTATLGCSVDCVSNLRPENSMRTI